MYVYICILYMFIFYFPWNLRANTAQNNGMKCMFTPAHKHHVRYIVHIHLCLNATFWPQEEYATTPSWRGEGGRQREKKMSAVAMNLVGWIDEDLSTRIYDPQWVLRRGRHKEKGPYCPCWGFFAKLCVRREYWSKS